MWAEAMAWAARLPFTLGFLSVMMAANWAAGTLSGRLPLRMLRDWGISHHGLVQGEVFRLVTGVFLSHDLPMFLRQIAFAACVIGYCEWHTGTAQTALLFAAIDVAGSLIVVFAILPLVAVHFPDSGLDALRSLDVGMSAGGFGLIGAILVLLPGPWGWLLAALCAIAVKAWLNFELIADTAHVVCMILGFAVQMTLPSVLAVVVAQG
jgi:hypothetical protein